VDTSDELSPADRELLDAARQARENSHSPVSNYAVGAALRAMDGAVYSGCNVENIVLSLTGCAEQVAIYKAISEGARRFEAIAVFTQSTPPAAPCGSCRQLLRSWGVSRVVMGNLAGEVSVVRLEDLIPRFFKLLGRVEV